MNVYLNTVEEITKALSEGKVVYVIEKEHTKPYKKLYLINGIIISYFIPGFRDYSTFIGNEVCLDCEDKFYIVEREPINIEIGKFYKTREGKKCICIYDDGNEWEFRVLNEKNSFWVGFDGVSNHNAMQDIVDYWEE